MKRLILLLALFISASAFAQSAVDGTWRVNYAKSQITQQPITISLRNGVYRCSSCKPPVEAKADGQEHNVAGQPDFDTLSVREIDARTVELARKKNGKPAAERKYTVSEDGKSLQVDVTNHPEGTDTPVVGKITWARLKKGPAGAHAISGSWRPQKVEDVSEQALDLTFKSTSDVLEMSTPTGEAFSAKFDGKDYPYKGNPFVTAVSLKKLSDRAIEETDKRDGKVVAVTRFSVSPDGKTLTIKVDDKVGGGTATLIAEKQ